MFWIESLLAYSITILAAYIKNNGPYAILSAWPISTPGHDTVIGNLSLNEPGLLIFAMTWLLYLAKYGNCCNCAFITFFAMKYYTMRVLHIVKFCNDKSTLQLVCNRPVGRAIHYKLILLQYMKDIVKKLMIIIMICTLLECSTRLKYCNFA